jgi:magnesium transporter
MEHADDVRDLLAYPPDSAGGLMRSEAPTLPIGMTSGEAIMALRRLNETLEDLFYVYVVDDEQRLAGVISFRDLVFARPHTGLDEVMVANPVAVRPETDREEVAELIQRYNLLAVPVVDHRGRLLGIVTVEEAIDAMQEEATEDIAAMVGAGVTETVYTPVRRSMANRLPWILVNLALAFVIAFSISLFEDTVAGLAVLAAYMPVVALVGGNSGAQSLAVVIRSLALGDVPSHRAGRVMSRETLVGFGNGVIVATLAALVAAAISGRSDIAVAIFIASWVNMTIAGFAGAGIPIGLRALGLDPALASNIFLTLVTDLVGFAGFLAIAALLI